MKKATKADKLQWMLENLQTYDEETINDISKKELLQSVADNILKEAIYTNNVIRHKGNLAAIIGYHLQGLPTWCNIPFANWEILELLRSWGYKLETESKEDSALAIYWAVCGSYIVELLKSEDILILDIAVFRLASDLFL